MFELRVLGPIELYDGPLRIDLVGVQLAVLTHLFLHANEPVASERLAGDVWNEGQPAVKRLHVAVTRLRKALDASAGTAGCLETVTGGYRLRIPAGCSDAERFHALALEGRRELGRERPAPAREALLTALGEWRGPALSDLAYYDFAQATIRQLEEERSSATEDRFECELRLGMHQDLVGELQSWISEHPGRERPVAQLMLALYRAGCQADALATYRDAYERLAEMGIEPGTGLQHLQLSILNHAPELELDLAEPAVAFKPAAPAHRIPTQGRFVGRTDDLAALGSHLDGALAGERRVVVVSGEPGIGKTHLMAELERMALERGARVLYGGAAVGALSERTADNTLPYQPFVEALGPYVREAADALSGAGLDAQLRECARIMPFDVGASPPDPSGEPSFQRFRLFEAVVDVVVHAAEHEPTVLILDDLQSADQATHQLLRHLVRALPPARLLVVAVHRADDGLGNFLLDLQHEGAMSHLALAGLGRADAGELVRDHLPDAAVATVERLVEATSGNPLFVRELVANVRAGGANWQLAPPEELDPPESVMYLVRRRLEGFREDTVSALRVAAVIGRDFDLDTVAHCVGKPDLEVLDALEQPLEAGMISEHQSVVDRYSFSHALVRAALYQSQSKSRRRRAHLAVGRALERARECHPAELANHFWHAREVGGAEPALEHLWQAGQLADAARAWEDAERSYQRALAVLELLPAVDGSRRGELELAHGHALERSGRADAARAAFRLAAATGQANDEPRLLALAALGYGRAPSSTDVADPELLALLDSALRAIGPEEEALRSRLLGRQAVERSSEPDGAAAAGRLGRQAVELAERAGDDSVLAVALASLHWTLESPDTLQERCRVARASLQLAQGANDLERVLGARIWWIFDLLELGDIPEVLAQLDAYERLAESLRHPGDRAYARVIRASLALLGGDLGAASGLVAEAHEGLVAAQDPDAERVSALQRFVLHQQAGRHDEAERAALDYPCPDAPDPAPLIRDALWGWAHASAGRVVEPASVEQVAGDRKWLVTVTALAHVAVLRRDAAEAARIYRALAPFADRLASLEGIVCLGPVAEPLAELALMLGHDDEARRLAESASEQRAAVERLLNGAPVELDAVVKAT